MAVEITRFSFERNSTVDLLFIVKRIIKDSLITKSKKKLYEKREKNSILYDEFFQTYEVYEVLCTRWLKYICILLTLCVPTGHIWPANHNSPLGDHKTRSKGLGAIISFCARLHDVILQFCSILLDFRLN